MGIETGSYISDLDQTWPLGADPIIQGDDHFRLVKKVLKQTFVGENGQGFNQPILATEDELNHSQNVTSNIQTQFDDISALIVALQNASVPVGSYIPYTGAFGAIPSGWVLADGNNGTVDMTDMFVMGTADAGQILANGGFADTELMQHTHVFVGDELPPHKHTYGDTNNPGASLDITSGSPSHVEVVTDTSEDTAGTPTGTNADAGLSDGIGKNLPPFWKMAYIVRMS